MEESLLGRGQWYVVGYYATSHAARCAAARARCQGLAEFPNVYGGAWRVHSVGCVALEGRVTVSGASDWTLRVGDE